MIETKRSPLVMFPNGALARCEVVPEDCVMVIEPLPEEEEFPIIIDQTEAVKEAENGNKP